MCLPGRTGANDLLHTPNTLSSKPGVPAARRPSARIPRLDSPPSPSTPATTQDDAASETDGAAPAVERLGNRVVRGRAGGCQAGGGRAGARIGGAMAGAQRLRADQRGVQQRRRALAPRLLGVAARSLPPSAPLGLQSSAVLPP